MIFILFKYPLINVKTFQEEIISDEAFAIQD
jgi:hypothetical protein